MFAVDSSKILSLAQDLVQEITEGQTLPANTVITGVQIKIRPNGTAFVSAQVNLARHFSLFPQELDVQEAREWAQKNR